MRVKSVRMEKLEWFLLHWNIKAGRKLRGVSFRLKLGKELTRFIQ